MMSSLGRACNDNRESIVVMRPLHDPLQGGFSLLGSNQLSSSQASGRDLSRNMPLVVGVVVAIHLPSAKA